MSETGLPPREAGDSRLKVMLHAPCAESLARARRNARNLKAASPEAEVLIITNAGGVAAAVATPDDTDAWLRLCRNSLDAQGIVDTRGLAIVEAAVLTLAEGQRQGWAYIRA